MTFNEIKDMINSTIVENGQRQITGQSINLALIETLTAIEEYLVNNKPEGEGAETVYVEETLTSEHQAVNASTYAKCKANVEEDKPLPAIVMDTTQMMAAQQGTNTDGIKMSMLPSQFVFVDPSAPAASEVGMAGLVCAVDGMTVTVNEDGSITIMQ